MFSECLFLFIFVKCDDAWRSFVGRCLRTTKTSNLQQTVSQLDKASHPHNRFSASHSRSLPTRLETFIFPNRYRQESILIDGTGECVYIHICFKNRKILLKKQQWCVISNIHIQFLSLNLQTYDMWQIYVYLYDHMNRYDWQIRCFISVKIQLYVQIAVLLFYTIFNIGEGGTARSGLVWPIFKFPFDSYVHYSKTDERTKELVPHQVCCSCSRI